MQIYKQYNNNVDVMAHPQILQYTTNTHIVQQFLYIFTNPSTSHDKLRQPDPIVHNYIL